MLAEELRLACSTTNPAGPKFKIQPPIRKLNRSPLSHKSPISRGKPGRIRKTPTVFSDCPTTFEDNLTFGSRIVVPTLERANFVEKIRIDFGQFFELNPRGFQMSPSSVSSSPAMKQLNAVLAGDATKANVAYAVAAKSAKINKEVAQATVDLLKTAADVATNSTSGRGIDIQA